MIVYFLPISLYLLLSTLPACAETVETSCPSTKVVVYQNQNPTNFDFKEWNKNCGNPRDYIYSLDNMVSALKNSNVVYLGETHNSKEDHEKQITIIQELYKQNHKIAIAMEMFQHPYQKIINQYLAGKLSEAELIEKSEYEKRWGFPWENYAPILRFAKYKKLPVIALNTPSEITHKVAREGLESLTPSERKLIPPLTEIRTDNEKYRQRLQAIFQQHQSAGHGNSTDADRFFQAQVVWDETMADRIAKFVKANPNYQVVVLAGQGHIVYGHGIPSRVTRRINDKTFSQRSILLSPPDETHSNNSTAIADFIFARE
ncbi:MAG: ChaN family lipoprotein [Scytonema sp. PMC 1070.18]|nr:ChaN family lipoprotein [Scytonema sp. PMC 1070.18]